MVDLPDSPEPVCGGGCEQTQRAHSERRTEQEDLALLLELLAVVLELLVYQVRAGLLVLVRLGRAVAHCERVSRRGWVMISKNSVCERRSAGVRVVGSVALAL